MSDMLQMLLWNHDGHQGIRPNFSNGLERSTMIDFEALLQSKFRMQHVADKQVASVHFLNKPRNSSLVVSINCPR